MRATTRLYVVPVWLRALAGLLALAALFAALSLIGTGARGGGDLQTLLLTGAQVIVDICMGGLFAYVAVTGLAPTHLMRSAGDVMDGQCTAFPPRSGHAALSAPAACAAAADHRVLDPRADCLKRRRADQAPAQWWLLVFGPAALAETLRTDWNIRRRDVRLFVVDVDTDSVSAAWGRPYAGTLADWRWEFVSDEVAHFSPPADAGEQMQPDRDEDTQGEALQIAERLWSEARRSGFSAILPADRAEALLPRYTRPPPAVDP